MWRPRSHAWAIEVTAAQSSNERVGRLAVGDFAYRVVPRFWRAPGARALQLGSVWRLAHRAGVRTFNASFTGVFGDEATVLYGARRELTAPRAGEV